MDITDVILSDHNEIRDAIQDVSDHPTGSNDWWQAIAKVNDVNGDHMAEEEREGLADFRQHADPGTRHSLAVAFCAFEATHAAGIEAHDGNPEAYLQNNSTRSTGA